MARVHVGLGANLGPARATIEWALRELGTLGVVRASGLYLSEPLGDVAQPWYVNAVAEVATDRAPIPLLRWLLDLERRAGRPARRPRWTPRVLDLDLLLYADRVMDSPELTLPHPEFHKRRFVLEPLVELCPALRDPRSGRSVSELLAGLSDPLRVERLPDAGPAGCVDAPLPTPVT